jgi:hypothetical protein
MSGGFSVKSAFPSLEALVEQSNKQDFEEKRRQRAIANTASRLVRNIYESTESKEDLVY